MLLIWTIYVAFPLVDMILPFDQWNPEQGEETNSLERDWRYLIPLYFTFTADFIVYFMSLHLAGYSPSYKPV